MSSLLILGSINPNSKVTTREMVFGGVGVGIIQKFSTHNDYSK
jgi:hypothetical protein